MPDYIDVTPEQIQAERTEQARRVTQGYEIGELRDMRTGELGLLRAENASLASALAAEREREEEGRKDRRALLMEVDALRSSLSSCHSEAADLAQRLHQTQQREGRLEKAIEAADLLVSEIRREERWSDLFAQELSGYAVARAVLAAPGEGE